MMKFTLANRPVKSTPQQYEKWIKGLEKELREIRALQDHVLAKVPKKLRSEGHLVSIESILGEDPL